MLFIFTTLKKGVNMIHAIKNLIATAIMATIISGTLSITELIAQENQPVLLIALIDNGTLRIEQYTLCELKTNSALLEEVRRQHTIFVINVADDTIVNRVVCNETTNGLIRLCTQKLTSDNDYYLNWGAMLGIDVAAYRISYVRLFPWHHHSTLDESTNDEQNISKTNYKGVIILDDIPQELHLIFDSPITSICGIMIPNEITKNINKNDCIINFADAVQHGIINHTSDANLETEEDEIERELSFGRILDAMEADGRFEIKKSSPFITWAKGMGGYVLVKYLMFKQWLTSWYKNLFYPKTSTTKIETQVKVITNRHE